MLPRRSLQGRVFGGQKKEDRQSHPETREVSKPWFRVAEVESKRLKLVNGVDSYA